MAEQTVVESGVIRVDASGDGSTVWSSNGGWHGWRWNRGRSVAGIARAHRINANQLGKRHPSIVSKP